MFEISMTDGCLTLKARPEVVFAGAPNASAKRTCESSSSVWLRSRITRCPCQASRSFCLSTSSIGSRRSTPEISAPSAGESGRTAKPPAVFCKVGALASMNCSPGDGSPEIVSGRSTVTQKRISQTLPDWVEMFGVRALNPRVVGNRQFREKKNSMRIHHIVAVIVILVIALASKQFFLPAIKVAAGTNGNPPASMNVLQMQIDKKDLAVEKVDDMAAVFADGD